MYSTVEHVRFLSTAYPSKAYLTASAENNIIVTSSPPRQHPHDHPEVWILKPILFPIAWVGSYRIFNMSHPQHAIKSSDCSRMGINITLAPYNEETDSRNPEFVWKLQTIADSRMLVRPIVAWNLNWSVPGNGKYPDPARVILWEHLGGFGNETWVIEHTTSKVICS
ncbi:11277_t:CDS:1 [Paraglomus brasilianum]|uniref:11277_t:CDS:1 n=1 Tax=Paraglomus brasilianum TaxID=144538 RepID=A0A9N9AZN8_9GLOM|nr:11277_t:CDS:1 [Paraglomus brasilianum]